MANPDDFLYEYAVIRYVPRIDRGEFMNVGLIMMCKRRRWIHSEIHLDEERLKALDPSVNIDSLKLQLGIFTKEGVPAGEVPVEERYRWLTAAKSAILQTSPSHPGIIMPVEDKLSGAPDISESNKNASSSNPKRLLEEEFKRLISDLVVCR